jgi:hypothetical protein
MCSRSSLADTLAFSNSNSTAHAHNHDCAIPRRPRDRLRSEPLSPSSAYRSPTLSPSPSHVPVLRAPEPSAHPPRMEGPGYIAPTVTSAVVALKRRDRGVGGDYAVSRAAG